MEYDSTSPLLAGATILQIIPALETGGAERTTLEVGKAIVEAGGSSLVVSEGGPMVEQLVAEGSTHFTLPAASKNPLQIWKNKNALQRLICDHDVDLVHARSRAPAWSALWAARAEQIKYVTTYHGIYKAKTALKRLYNSAMARGDMVIANSDFTAAAVKESFGASSFFDPEHMVTIPRGADLTRFNPDLLDDDRRSAAAEAFGGDDAFRILLPGRLTDWKGQAILINAASLLQRRSDLPRFRIVMIGSAQGRDEYAASLDAAIKEHGLTDQIHIHGHWDDMPAAYDWADVTVSASTRPEAFGRVSIESQAMARPVIATAHGGSLETIADEETGLLVSPGNSEEMADAIVKMMQKSVKDRDGMGKAAEKRAKLYFSTEVMTQSTIFVYKRVLNDVGRRIAP